MSEHCYSGRLQYYNIEMVIGILLMSLRISWRIAVSLKERFSEAASIRWPINKTLNAECNLIGYKAIRFHFSSKNTPRTRFFANNKYHSFSTNMIDYIKKYSYYYEGFIKGSLINRYFSQIQSDINGRPLNFFNAISRNEWIVLPFTQINIQFFLYISSIDQLI